MKKWQNKVGEQLTQIEDRHKKHDDTLQEIHDLVIKIKAWQTPNLEDIDALLDTPLNLGPSV